MKPFFGASLYYSLFGTRGLILAAKSRFLRRPVQVAVEMDGISHPLFLRLRTTDIALCRDILIDLQYDCQFAREPRIIVDAGANIGLTSVFYANKYPRAKIIAIEPETSNFEMLLKNTGPYPNITAICAGLWNRRGELRITDSRHGNHAFQTHEAEKSIAEEGANFVQSITMTEVIENSDTSYIDLLKVDIEGAEMEVFENAWGWIGCVGVIAIECHDWIKSGCLEVVRRATRDFDFEWKRGETIYFARNAYFHCKKSAGEFRTDLADEIDSKNEPAFPLKIVQVI